MKRLAAAVLVIFGTVSLFAQNGVLGRAIDTTSAVSRLQEVLSHHHGVDSSGIEPATCGSAPTLFCGGSVTTSPSCLSGSYYLDLYLFNATAGQTVTLNVSTFTGYQELITVQDFSTGTILKSNYGPSPVSLTYTFPTSGPYIVGFGYIATFATGTYTLAVSCGSTNGGTCVPDTFTACMLNNRFKVTVRYRGSFDDNGADHTALLKPVTGFANTSFETAFFYFNDANNIEMMVKLLDQGNTNGAGQRTIALLFGSATPLRSELTITDTAPGNSNPQKTYISHFNTQSGTTDFTAFVK